MLCASARNILRGPFAACACAASRPITLRRRYDMPRWPREFFSRNRLFHFGHASGSALSGPAMKTGWLSLALLATVPVSVVVSTSTTLHAATCGNGIVEAGEGCDVGADAECPGACLINCKCGVAPPAVALN